ncbi:hypothetical protein N7475_000745 [Penicillium sp. IBT 31633x]|nr:hypothetical protein N7475_000745 [Penicillium sp. IBT 31633x]
MATVQSYYEQTSSFDWIEAISGDNGGIDPRQVHSSLMTFQLHWGTSNCHNHESDQESESEETPSPQSSPRSSLEYLRTNFPLKLEHEPPVPRPNLSESSLFGLHNQISQAHGTPSCPDLLYEEDGDSLTTISTDEEYERCMLPFCGALPTPSEESSPSPSSPSWPSSPKSPKSPQPPPTAEAQWLPLVVGRVVSSKARKACRVLKRKLSGGPT